MYVLTPGKNAPGAGDTPTARPVGYVVFGEAAPAVTTVNVESIGAYAELPASASNPATHGVTVTVLDQYGRPMSNQPVTLTSEDEAGGTTNSANSAMPGMRRTTSTGSVRIFYSHSGTTAFTETSPPHGPETTDPTESIATMMTSPTCLAKQISTGLREPSHQRIPALLLPFWLEALTTTRS